MTEGVVLVSQDQQQPSLSATSKELKTMLDVIQKEILPATEKGVSNGNKVFGAAILNADLQCEIASTNAETDCPIFHGEVKCIVNWSQPDMEFVKNFTQPDFQAKNFTSLISPNFNSFGKITQKMSENGEIYTTSKNFTQ